MFYKLLNTVQLNYKHKKKFFNFKIKNYDKEVIKILIKYNIIKYVRKTSKFTIFLKYMLNKPVFELKNLYKPSNIRYISYKNLIKLNNTRHIYILSTNIGIISSIEAKKKKIGGVLVVKIIT
jgi:ribosomal protein S8